VHFPLEQANPVSHRLSAQHVSPLPPQDEQVFFVVHTFPSAQRSPAGRHVLPVGIVVSQQPVLHVSPAQQGCPSPPQPAQSPEGRQRSPL